MKCEAFRANITDEVLNAVISGYTHESDSTCQDLAQYLLQRLGRPAAKRLSTEVMQQRGYMWFTLLQIDRGSGTELCRQAVGYDWHSKSVAMLGKSGVFNLRALEDDMPMDLGDHEGMQGAWQAALEEACDSVVIDQFGDKGSSNMASFLHIAHEFRNLPKKVRDVDNCELHNLQNLKNAVSDIRVTVGHLFCWSNCTSHASVHDGIIAAIEYLSHITVMRLTRPPPSGRRTKIR